MRIAAFDTNPTHLKLLGDQIKGLGPAYAKKIESFTAVDHLEAFVDLIQERPLPFDLLFFSPETLGNAMSIMSYLDAAFVLIGDSSEGVFHGYDLGAKDFLLFPFSKADLASALRKAGLFPYPCKNLSMLCIRGHGSTYRFDVQATTHVIGEGNTSVATPIKGNPLIMNLTLNALVEQLQDCKCFVRIHQHSLVNLSYIETMKRYETTLISGTCLKISKTRYNDCKQLYRAYLEAEDPQ